MRIHSEGFILKNTNWVEGWRNLQVELVLPAGGMMGGRGVSGRVKRGSERKERGWGWGGKRPRWLLTHRHSHLDHSGRWSLIQMWASRTSYCSKPHHKRETLLLFLSFFFFFRFEETQLLNWKVA